MDREMLHGLGALALIVLAPLVCAPAAACPQTQVAEAEPAPPQAAPPQAELKFDWPVRGRIVYGCGIEDKERITIAARNGAEVRAAQSGVVVVRGRIEALRECRSDQARGRVRVSVSTATSATFA